MAALRAALTSLPAAVTAAFAALLLGLLPDFVFLVFVAMMRSPNLWDMRPGARCAG
jgi:hypothetical protein